MIVQVRALDPQPGETLTPGCPAAAMVLGTRVGLLLLTAKCSAPVPVMLIVCAGGARAAGTGLIYERGDGRAGYGGQGPQGVDSSIAEHPIRHHRPERGSHRSAGQSKSAPRSMPGRHCAAMPQWLRHWVPRPKCRRSFRLETDSLRSMCLRRPPQCHPVPRVPEPAVVPAPGRRR